MTKPHQRAHRTTSAGRLEILTGLLPLALLLIVWELVGSPNSPFYPAPSSWWPALFVRGQGEDIIPAIIDTTKTFGFGLVLATGVGVGIGVGVGVSARTDRAVGPALEFGRALPPASIVPVATLLLGFDEPMKLFVVVLAAVWPIMLNTRTAVRNLDPILLDMARSLGLSRGRTVAKVLLPAATSSVLLGVRVATPVALVITLLVEYLTGVNGLGALIGDAQRTFQPARVYALIVIAGLISLAVNSMVRRLDADVHRRRMGG